MLKPLSQLADTAKDEEPVQVAGDTEPAAVEAAPSVDPIEALGDAIVEQAPPSLDEAPATPSEAPVASVTEAAPAEPKNEAEPAPETQDDPLDKQFKDLASALAEQKGIPVEEAEAMLAREARLALAQKMGATPQQARDDDKDAEKRKQIEQAMRYGGGTGGGGAVASLVSGLSSGLRSAKSGLSGAVQGIRSVPEVRREYLRNRCLRQWQKGFDDSVESFYEQGDKIKAAVEEFNAAFLKTEAAARLRKMAEDNGQSLDDYMKDLRRGSATSPEAVAAAEKAASDPQARAAYQKLEAAMQAGEKAGLDAEGFQKKLLRNFPDSVDGHAMSGKLSGAQADLLDGLKEPIYAPKDKGENGADKEKAAKDQKEFMERIREMTEAIQRMIDRLLSKLGLKSGPKA